MKEFCNNIYRDLVARLGEIQLQLDQLSKEKKAILNQLTLLNALSPELQKREVTEKAKADYVDGVIGC